MAAEVLLRWAGLLSCAFCTGCLVPYGYPNLAHVPTLALGRQPADVHAFRVDLTADIVDIGETDHCLLAEVPPHFGGYVPPQTRLTLDYGLYVIGIALNYPVHRGHATVLRLYRPGYQLAEVSSWEVAGRVEWKKAADAAAQEQAVDDLLAVPDLNAPQAEFAYGKGRRYWQEGWSVRHLEPGRASPQHRAALLFAASEYERIAERVPAGDEQQARRNGLRDKAGELRRLAGEPAPSREP